LPTTPCQLPFANYILPTACTELAEGPFAFYLLSYIFEKWIADPTAEPAA
jgi:hypothetical protein